MNDKLAEDEVDAGWTDVRSKLAAEHRVVWTLEQGNVYGTPVCAGNEQSPCHAYCDQGCEQSPCPHPPKAGRSCGSIDWFEDPMAEYYDGPDTMPRNAAITLHWDGDYYTWWYADEPKRLPA